MAQQKTKRGIPTMSRYTYFWQKHYVAFQNCQRYTVDFPPVYGILNENKLLRAQLNQEGDTNIPFTVTVYLFLAKHTMSLFILSWF